MKIKDLNLNEEVIQTIAKTLNRSEEDIVECEEHDYHIEKDALSMLKWLYDDLSGDEVVHVLTNMKVINPQLSLFENFLLNHECIFKAKENCWLYLYDC